MQMKRNIYIFLTFVCILGAILIQSLAAPAPLAQKEFKFDIDNQKLAASPHQLIFLLLTIGFILLLITGTVNLIIFAIRKLQKKSVSEISEKEKKLPLSEEASAKLLFSISLILFAIYLLPLIMKTYGIKALTINIPLLLNIVLQLSVMALIFAYVRANFFGFYFDKKQTVLLLRLYSALFVVLLGTSILNSMVIKKLGLKISPGPVIELFFLLNNKFSFLLLILQAVLLAPIAEELFFRGFIYKLCRNQYSFIASAVLTSSIFSLVHRTPQTFLPLFFISLFLCYIYEKTQNILPAILFHSIHNSLTLFVLFLIKPLISS